MKTAALAAVLGLAAFGSMSAQAAVTVSASGKWAENVPTTAYSAPGATFSFSFNVPNPYSYVTAINGTAVPTTIPATELSSFSYSLGGTVLPTTISNVFAPFCSASLSLCDVELFPTGQGGGLTLDFGDHSVDFFGVNNVSLGDQGVLTLGNYSFIPNIDGVVSTINGEINEGSGLTLGSVVPEPATWAMMGFGVFGAGAMSRRSRQRRALAAA